MPSVFITGANRGLGLEFARQYAADGWQVVATCRHPERAEALAALRVEMHRLDVADGGAAAGLAQGALRNRRFDVLLNNAGVYGDGPQAFGSLDPVEWERVLRVNVIAPLKVAEAFLPHVLAGQRKLMAFVSSRMGSIGDNSGGGAYLYRSSKAALNAAVKSLSIDLAPQGITAVLLHPGWVLTDMGGPAATMLPAASIAGMRQVIEGTRPADSGSFHDYTGAVMPW